MLVVARLLRGAGELLITGGVVVLLFVVYLLYWTDLENSRTQRQLGAALDRQWATAPAPLVAAPGVAAPAGPVLPALGKALGRIYIPRLGRDYRPVMVEGVATADLAEGPGHYPDTALPGEKGNFAVAGHRVTQGKPFNRLDEVKPDDRIVVETQRDWVTYRVVGEEVVDPSAVEVAEPVPPAIGDQPRGADHLLTFTTCNPKYSATTRLVLRAVWESTDSKRPGFVPAALQAA